MHKYVREEAYDEWFKVKQKFVETSQAQQPTAEAIAHQKIPI